MRFSLLKPPEDAPSRIPLSRGVPSAEALNVNTNVLPRALPIPHLDADAVALPYQALARLGAQGVKVTEDVSNLILAAEAKKREVNNHAASESLYTEMALNVDQDFEQQKISESDETLRPAFNKMWNGHLTNYLAQAPNAEVRADLQLKLNKLLIAKSAEVSDVTRTKFVSRQEAQLNQDVDEYTRRATDPNLPELQQLQAERDLERRLLLAGRSGLFKPENLQKMGERSLDTIKVERAKTHAYTEPLHVLESFAIGETFGLDGKQQRNLMEYATGRLATMRAERDQASAAERRQRSDRQDALAIDIRTQITENYAENGPKTNLLSTINANARKLGEQKHQELVEMNRVYAERAAKVEKQPDRELIGQLQSRLTGPHWQDVTQAELLGYFRQEKLDATNHRYFSNMLDRLTDESKKAPPDTPEQKARKEDIALAEKSIETYISQSSKLIGTVEARSSAVLAQDAIVELRRQAKAHPELAAEDIANSIIAKKVAAYQWLKDGLPYQSREAVTDAYSRDLISKQEASRYYAIYDLLDKNPAPPKKKVTPPAPTMWQRFFGGGEQPESGIRAPVPRH